MYGLFGSFLKNVRVDNCLFTTIKCHQCSGPKSLILFKCTGCSGMFGSCSVLPMFVCSGGWGCLLRHPNPNTHPEHQIEHATPCCVLLPSAPSSIPTLCASALSHLAAEISVHPGAAGSHGSLGRRDEQASTCRPISRRR